MKIYLRASCFEDRLRHKQEAVVEDDGTILDDVVCIEHVDNTTVILTRLHYHKEVETFYLMPDELLPGEPGYKEDKAS